MNRQGRDRTANRGRRSRPGNRGRGGRYVGIVAQMKRKPGARTQCDYRGRQVDRESGEPARPGLFGNRHRVGGKALAAAGRRRQDRLPGNGEGRLRRRLGSVEPGAAERAKLFAGQRFASAYGAFHPRLVGRRRSGNRRMPRGLGRHQLRTIIRTEPLRIRISNRALRTALHGSSPGSPDLLDASRLTQFTSLVPLKDRRIQTVQATGSRANPIRNENQRVRTLSSIISARPAQKCLGEIAAARGSMRNQRYRPKCEKINSFSHTVPGRSLPLKGPGGEGLCFEATLRGGGKPRRDPEDLVSRPRLEGRLFSPLRLMFQTPCPSSRNPILTLTWKIGSELFFTDPRISVTSNQSMLRSVCEAFFSALRTAC